MATLIKTDGTETEVAPANGKKFTLEEMQKYVGGFIQYGATNDKRVMVMDEEGKVYGKSRNPKATALYQYGSADPIVGDVLVGTKKELY